MVRKFFLLFIFACLVNLSDYTHHHQSPTIFIKISSKSRFFPAELVKVNKRAEVNFTEVFAKTVEECNHAAKIVNETADTLKKSKSAQKGVVSYLHSMTIYF